MIIMKTIMKTRFNLEDELPLNKMIEIPSVAIVVIFAFMKITNIIHKFSVSNIKMESKDMLNEIDIKNRTCYYYDDVMGVDKYIDFDRILLDKKSFGNI